MLDNKETTQNYFKGLTRKDYIERVCKIMEKDGAEDLSIRRIAKELGCSSAALYRYFNSKSELMYYVSLNTLEGYIIRLNQAEKTWRGVWDIYVGVWYCYSQEAFRHPKDYNRLFFEHTNEYLGGKCVKAGAISEENALILNRMSCILYKGYFKGVMDDGIEEDEIEERVRSFIDDLDIIVKALASELQGYDGYFKQKREKNDKK